MKRKEAAIRELEDLPAPLLKEVLVFARFLKHETALKAMKPALLSEAILGRDWLQSEEDQAWNDL